MKMNWKNPKLDRLRRRLSGWWNAGATLTLRGKSVSLQPARLGLVLAASLLSLVLLVNLLLIPSRRLLTVDMEERRIAPLAGRWASVLHPGATAAIRRGPECYILPLPRPGEGFRHGRTFRLRYRRGIYYLDAGRRVALYAPTTIRLLLLPGVSYRRITNLKKHDS